MNKKQDIKENADVQTEEQPEGNDVNDQEVDTDGSQTKGKSGRAKKEAADKEQNLKAEFDGLKEKYLRLYAEFDNYKKRTIKEKLDLMRTAAEDTLSALLPVLDDFDRAKKTADDEESPETFSTGVELVYHKLYSVLNAHGLHAMESDGQPFDPELHEAVTEIPVEDKEMKGRVVDTIEKGYFLNDKIIRHAKVVVGK